MGACGKKLQNIVSAGYLPTINYAIRLALIGVADFHVKREHVGPLDYSTMTNIEIARSIVITEEGSCPENRVDSIYRVAIRGLTKEFSEVSPFDEYWGSVLRSTKKEVPAQNTVSGKPRS